jgi:Fic-DOC domain mobile mystery protein B
MSTDLFASADDATPISADEQPALIPSITTRPELNQLERLNITAARTWAMRRTVFTRPDLLSDVFARELHRRMFNRVWAWAGRYRTTEKNIGWEAHRLAEGVRNTFDDAQAWFEFSTYPLIEIAVRLHHRLVLIHPWPNGNGRHARLMADIVIAAYRGTELTWGAKHDLTSIGDVRRRYIDAVRAADQGDFGPLIAFAQS